MTLNNDTSEKLSLPSKYIEVYGSKMHYLEEGKGDPILFLHGIPTSSYLWRKVIPHLSPLGRCIAPDLIGFGKSDKPDINYSIHDHIKYIEEFIRVLGLSHVTLVMHGWGSVIGFDYAMRHEQNCKGLAFYETFLRSLNDTEVALPFKEQMIHIQDAGSTELLMDSTFFVDRIIPQVAMRQLSQQEMQHYREPFEHKGAGKPILQFLKEISGGKNENEVEKIIVNYTKKLMQSQLPKLLLYSIPGFVTTIATVMWAKEHLPKLEIVDIGEELHLAQESCPELMGESISIWLQGFE